MRQFIAGTACPKVKNRTDTNPAAEFNHLVIHYWRKSGMIDRLVEAAIAGATLAASTAIWLLVGYLIQRFAFRNPKPSYATVFATSLSTSMLLFSLVALLAFHIRYDYPGAANGVVQTVR